MSFKRTDITTDYNLTIKEIMELVQYFIDNGVRLDGVKYICHDNDGWNLTNFEPILDSSDSTFKSRNSGDCKFLGISAETNPSNSTLPINVKLILNKIYKVNQKGNREYRIPPVLIKFPLTKFEEDGFIVGDSSDSNKLSSKIKKQFNEIDKTIETLEKENKKYHSMIESNQKEIDTLVEIKRRLSI